MSITYKYTILSVDIASRCMEVVYSAEGRQTMHIGARLPFEGESLEDVIIQYAPENLWLSLETPVVAPKVGLTGTIKPGVQLSGEMPVTEI